MSQLDDVLRYMQTVGPITGRKASQELDCDRLPARIWELKALGVPIKSRRVSKLDERGKEIKHWEEYYLA